MKFSFTMEFPRKNMQIVDLHYNYLHPFNPMYGYFLGGYNIDRPNFTISNYLYVTIDIPNPVDRLYLNLALGVEIKSYEEDNPKNRYLSNIDYFKSKK